MKDIKRTLVLSAIELVKIGEELESAKSTLKHLVDQGVPYESPQMIAALSKCQNLTQRWKDAEAKHLDLILLSN